MDRIQTLKGVETVQITTALSMESIPSQRNLEMTMK